MSYYNQASKNQGASAPDLVFTEGKVKFLGDMVGGHAPSLGSIAEKTGAIHGNFIEFPGFSAAGQRADWAHSDACAGGMKAFKAAKAVLDSWQKALNDTEKNYQAVEKENGGKGSDKDGGKGKDEGKGSNFGAQQAGLDGLGSGMPNLTGSAMPGSAMPGSAMPGSAMPGSGMPGSAMPGSGMPGSAMPGSGMPGSGMPGSGMTAPAMPDSGLTAPARPDTSPLPDTRTTTPTMPDRPEVDGLVNNPGTNLPGLDQDALKNSLSDQDTTGPGGKDFSLPTPQETDLSANTSNVPTPQLNVPDSATSPGNQPGAGSATRVGDASGGSSSTGNPLLNKSSVAGMNGMNGMPFMPPMGGGGAPGAEQKQNEESNYRLSEDERVWGEEESVVPVLGREA